MFTSRWVFAIIVVAVAVSLIRPTVVSADPCLMVYPTGPTRYHYDTNEYYTVTFGHPLYDPAYDRGGEVLIDINTGEIALDIYLSPRLTGFDPSIGGQEGYFFMGSSLDLVIDGRANKPAVYRNILLVFDPDPGSCQPLVTVNMNTVIGDSYAMGTLVVSQPTPYESYEAGYSENIVAQVKWQGCYGVRIWAFADENYNGVKDGGECFTAFSHDVTVPVQHETWGAIKNFYK